MKVYIFYFFLTLLFLINICLLVADTPKYTSYFYYYLIVVLTLIVIISYFYIKNKKEINLFKKPVVDKSLQEKKITENKITTVNNWPKNKLINVFLENIQQNVKRKKYLYYSIESIKTLNALLLVFLFLIFLKICTSIYSLL